MKKLIVLFLACLLFTVGSAEASVSNMTAQLGVYNSTDGTYGLEVDNNNSFHFSQTGASIYYPGQVSTTNLTLTANQSGQTFVMTGTSNDTKFTLPTAVPGMKYTFINDTTAWIRIKPQSTDTINFSTFAAGQAIQDSTSTAKGDFVIFYCMVANKWSIVRGGSGTWVVGSSN